jgi:hypothetical protein
MLYFQTKNTKLGKSLRVLQWKMLEYFMAIGSNVRIFGIFYGHLVYFVEIWVYFPRSGILYQEKSGNPDAESVIFAFPKARCNLTPYQRGKQSYLRR